MNSKFAIPALLIFVPVWVLAFLFESLPDGLARSKAWSGDEMTRAFPIDPSEATEGGGSLSTQLIRELVTALLDYHVSLEGVTRRDFHQRCYAHWVQRLTNNPEEATLFAPLTERSSHWSELLDVLDQEMRADQKAESNEPRSAQLALLREVVLDEVGDPFTQLFRGSDLFSFEAFFQSMFPEWVGIDLQESKEGAKEISFVMAGSDADHKGLRRGDRVLAINRRPVESWSLSAARREVEKPVTLEVHREGWTRSTTVSLFASLPGGTYGCLLEDRIGYLCYRMFNGTAMQLRDLGKSLIDQGAQGFILDLRGNPGGYVVDGWALASLFVERGAVISRLHQREQVPQKLPEVLLGTGPSFSIEFPLVVLVNGSSASASELVAGGLKDLRRGMIVGGTTYGKGIGQMPIPFDWEPSFDAGLTRALEAFSEIAILMVSCMRFDSPRGNNVQGIGLTPDLRCAEALASPEAMEARAKYADHSSLVRHVGDLKLSDQDLVDLRGDRVPKIVLECARKQNVDPRTPAEHAGLAHVTRVLHGARSPELLAVPLVDPQLDKAVQTMRVLLR